MWEIQTNLQDELAGPNDRIILIPFRGIQQRLILFTYFG
jgi:hypothetical protein